MSLKIKNSIVYHSNYESSLIQGIDDPETPRPWNLFHEIGKHVNSNKILLDIGCGTANKLIPFSQSLIKIIGIDSSQSMLIKAQENISNAGVENFTLIMGKAEQLPLKHHSVDIVTNILSRVTAKEIYRVIKPDGVAIIEHIGCEDKKYLKLLFGKDELGMRGQFLEYSLEEYINLFYTDLSHFFNEVSIQNGYWNTYYSKEGLQQLLLYTPTIRNYNQTLDQDYFNETIKNFSTRKGIKLTQNRILIYAKNPRTL